MVHRLSQALFVAAVVALAIVFSFLLLRSTTLAVGLFLVFLVLALLVLEPYVGLLVYIFLIYTGPQAYVPALAGLRVMLVVGGATLVSAVGRGVLAGARSQRLSTPVVYMFLWFFVAILASHLVHLDFRSAGQAALDFFSDAVLFILLVKLVWNEDRLRMVFRVIFVGTVILALQGIAQHVIGSGLLKWQEFGQGRIAGIGHFANPNMLAIGLVCGLPIGYVVLADARRIATKAGIVVCMGAMLYALYLTNSRGGVLSLGVVVSLVLFRKLGIVRGLVLSGAVFVLIIVFGPSRMSEISTSEASAATRLEAWHRGYAIFETSPIFGIGAGAWYTKYKALVPHNSLIHCAAELGLFGVIPWVLMLFQSVRNLWYVEARAESEAQERLRPYARALFVSLSGFIFASFFISKTYNVLLFILVALSTALLEIYVRDSREKYRLITWPEFLAGVVVALCGLAVFKVFLIMVHA